MKPFAYPRPAELLPAAWIADRYVVLLVGAGYEPRDSHQWITDVKDEIRGGNYDRRDLTGRFCTLTMTAKDAGECKVEYRADNPGWHRLVADRAVTGGIVARLGKRDASSRLLTYTPVVGHRDAGAPANVVLRWGGVPEAGGALLVSWLPTPKWSAK